MVGSCWLERLTGGTIPTGVDQDHRISTTDSSPHRSSLCRNYVELESESACRVVGLWRPPEPVICTAHHYQT
ncbi:hypothetical protein EYF80_032167 [Liparis tanakae]|uniref:Uncharacterized protein n=1 Tax=Liparis tanakae TaxID=230148 RepID=A0A4Z2GVG9_9TELE|nr:hypothetical protein EYF80_032167 [Liparis tanakae]